MRIATLCALALAPGLAPSYADSRAGDPMPADGDAHEIFVSHQADGRVLVDLRVDGEWATLELERRPVRAPGFRVEVSGPSGLRRPVASPPVTTYRGTVLGVPGSDVAASFEGDEFHALLYLGEAGYRLVQPDLGPGLDRVAHRVSGGQAAGEWCGVVGEGSSLRSVQSPPPPRDSLAAEGSSLQVIEVACDADVEFFDSFGGQLDAAVKSIESRVAMASLVYEHDLDLQLMVSFVHVWKQEEDPYSGMPGPPHTLAQEMKAYWNANFSDVARDTAHLFTAKPVTSLYDGKSGYALGSVCLPTHAYAWNGVNSTLGRQARILAHEIGHQLTVVHCDASPGCQIMCSFTCSANYWNFGQGSIDTVNGYVAGLSCLDPSGAPSPSPQLSSVAPDVVPAFQPGTTVLSGSHLDTVLDVEVDGIVFPYVSPEWALVSDVEIVLDLPEGQVLGPVDVSVFGPGGSSNVVTLTYTETSPPALVAEGYAFAGYPFSWHYAGPIGDTATLLLAIDDDSMNSMSPPYLANGAVVQTTTLTGTGIEVYTRDIPQSLIGSTLYAQVVSHAPGGGHTVSPVMSTVVLQW